MLKQLAVILIALLGFSGIAQAKPAGDNACQVIKDLVNSYATGFSSLRKKHVNTRYGDIWKAKYKVVGDECEIWRGGSDRFFYVCTRSAPNKAVADEYFKEAKDGLQRCLGNHWAMSERSRDDGIGKVVHFRSSVDNVAAEIHEVKVEGIFKDQWTLYYVLGDPSMKLNGK